MRYHQKAYTEENDFIYRRCFEMPTHNTFQLKSVNKLLSRYIDKSNISKYDKSKSFPNNLIASVFSFKHEALFKIDESERKNVKVSF